LQRKSCTQAVFSFVLLSPSAISKGRERSERAARTFSALGRDSFNTLAAKVKKPSYVSQENEKDAQKGVSFVLTAS